VEAVANLLLKVSSLFSQIIAEIPRTDFEKLVAKHGTGLHTKGFVSYNLAVTGSCFQFPDVLDNREIIRNTSFVYSFLPITRLISTNRQRNIKTRHQGAS
jgi:hypothetical protein